MTNLSKTDFPSRPKPFTTDEYIMERCPKTRGACEGCKYYDWCKLIYDKWVDLK